MDLVARRPDGIDPDSSGEEVRRPLLGRLRARGNMRKKVCNYPPLQLKFKKEQLHEAGLDSSFNDVKMVLQCRDGEVGNLYLLREYLIYKLYENIGPIHYKTRLVRLVMDNGNGRATEEALAFLIEKEDEFQARLGGNVIEEGIIRNSIIDRQAYTRMCFFQYLILNNDWSIYAKHNMEFIKLKTSPQVFPVPYDFDYSGWVMTNYAAPPPELPIKQVSDPYFRGQKLTAEEVLSTAQFFLERKDDLYATCSRFTLLDDREQRRMVNLLDDFYRTVENEKYLVRNFANLR